MSVRTTRMKVILNITNIVLHLFLNILFYVFVIFAITRLSTVAYDFSYQIFGSKTLEQAPGRDITVQIKKGESTRNIASKLELNRVIENQYSFYVKTKLMDYNLLPGTYVVNSSMTYSEILSVITDPGMNLENNANEDEKASDGV